MTKYPTELKNYTELIAYLRRCLAQEDKESRPDIASWIVGIIANDHYHEWCNDRRYPEFCRLFNIASDMELPDMYEKDFVAFGLHDEYWQRLKAFVDLFEKKLEIWPRLKTIQDVVEYLNACLESKWLRDDIALSILALNENEHFTQLLKSGKYPELTKIMEAAVKMEASPVGLKIDESNKIHLLVFQLATIYALPVDLKAENSL